MSEITWMRAKWGRVIHGFTNEFRETKNPRRIYGPRKVRKTLCGKWFGEIHPPFYNSFGDFKKCKKCLAKLGAE